jgi:hypothetical protein
VVLIRRIRRVSAGKSKRSAARSSSIVIVGENELPRPGRDTTCCPGLLSAYNELVHGHHVVRRRGTATSYLVYSVSGFGFFRDSKNRAIQIGPGDLALLQARNYQEYGTSPTSRQWACHWVHFDAQPHWWPWIPLPNRVALQGLSLARTKSPSSQRQLNNPDNYLVPENAWSFFKQFSVP